MIFTAYGSRTSTIKQNDPSFAELDETQAALTPGPSPRSTAMPFGTKFAPGWMMV